MSVLAGFLKAAGIPLGLIDDIPMMLSMGRNQQLSKRKKQEALPRPPKVANGDMMEDVKTSYQYLISKGLAAGNR